jgi:hypothetical protein
MKFEHIFTVSEARFPRSTPAHKHFFWASKILYMSDHKRKYKLVVNHFQYETLYSHGSEDFGFGLLNCNAV